LFFGCVSLALGLSNLYSAFIAGCFTRLQCWDIIFTNEWTVGIGFQPCLARIIGKCEEIISIFGFSDSVDNGVFRAVLFVLFSLVRSCALSCK